MQEEKAFQDIAAVFRYDRDRIARWMRAGMGKRYRIYMLIFAVMAVNFLLAIPTAQPGNLPVFIFLFAVCLVFLGLVFYRARSSGKSLTAVDKLYNEGKEYRAFFREDGFSFKSGDREEKILYGETSAVVETDECFRLVYREKEVFILPKEALSDEQAAQLSHFLSGRFEKNYRYAA